MLIDKANVKKIQLLVPDKELFLENLKNQKIDIKIINFFKSLIEYEVDKTNIKSCDIITLDKYKYNFYDYSQKTNSAHVIFFKKLKFNKIDKVFSNYDPIGIKNDEAIKLAFKPSKKLLYEKLKKINFIKKIITIKNDIFLIYKYNPMFLDSEKIDYLYLKEKIIKYWYDYKLWVNNINYDTLRNNYYFNDPEMFYYIDTAEIKTLKNKEFVEFYRKYKLRPKEILYILNQNYIDKEAAIYMYHSYNILENLSRIF